MKYICLIKKLDIEQANINKKKYCDFYYFRVK